MKTEWPKDIVCWDEPGGRLCMTVPFTWLLPKAQRFIDSFPGPWLVGGPAVYLMPSYLKGCDIGHDYAGVLQRINPLATRTTLGCPRSCSFCGVKQIEPKFIELETYSDLPIICDNNLTAASYEHFEMVCCRLQKHGWCDFNQGLDCRLLTPWHALRIAKIGKPMVRMSLDSEGEQDAFANAVDYLLTVGIPKSRIRGYVLVGNGSVESCWRRCEFVDNLGPDVCPQWLHSLHARRYGEITPRQEIDGWTKAEQRKIMRYYYRHTTRTS